MYGGTNCIVFTKDAQPVEMAGAGRQVGWSQSCKLIRHGRWAAGTYIECFEKSAVYRIRTVLVEQSLIKAGCARRVKKALMRKKAHPALEAGRHARGSAWGHGKTAATCHIPLRLRTHKIAATEGEVLCLVLQLEEQRRTVCGVT